MFNEKKQKNKKELICLMKEILKTQRREASPSLQLVQTTHALQTSFPI